MESTVERHIKSLKQYEHLFPQYKGEYILIKRGAELKDTLNFIPLVIRKTLHQTKRLAKELIKGKTQEESCRNAWQFVYDHIEFVKDREKREEIRSPQDTLNEQKGDCDDFTVLISSILLNCGIPVMILRTAMYREKNGYQHIYPVAQLSNGRKIIVDAVTEKFNYEVPYIKKIDQKMDLYYLNGFGSTELPENSNIDAQDLFKDDLGDLGRWRFKDSKFFKAIKNGIHAINKFNPATALLRGGVLASMKLNLFKVAGRIKYGYLTDDQARKKHFDMARFAKLKNILDKLIKIFHGAGGEDQNLKKAILTGKGNPGGEVPLNGLGYVDTNTYTENTPLATIIGDETYNAEIKGVEGLSGTLGEPVTGAAIAAATAVMSAIAALIKNIGPLKKDGSDQSDAAAGGDTTSTDTTNANAGSGTDTSTNIPPQSTDSGNNSNGGANTNPGGDGTETPAGGNDSSAGNDAGSDSRLPNTTNKNEVTTTNNKDTSTNTTPSPEPGKWDKFKKWVTDNPLAATGIGVVVASGVTYGVYKLVAPKKEKNAAVSGLPRHKKRKHNTHSKRKKHNGNAQVRFMRLK